MNAYALTVTVFVDNDADAREQLAAICDELCLDNDDYEFNTSIVNKDTGEKVSIYSPDYPEALKQNPGR